MTDLSITEMHELLQDGDLDPEHFAIKLGLNMIEYARSAEEVAILLAERELMKPEEIESYIMKHVKKFRRADNK